MRCWKEQFYLLYVLFNKEILIVWNIVINNNVRDRDRMEVGFTTTYAITTNVVSSNPASGEV